MVGPSNLIKTDLFCDFFFFQVASKYGMPPEMIKNVYKKTKKG